MEKPSKAKKVKGPWEKDVKKKAVTGSSSYGNAIVSTGNYVKSDISLLPVPPTAFPQSVSVAALLQARKLVKPPNVIRVKLELERYIVAEKKRGKWNFSKKMLLLQKVVSEMLSLPQMRPAQANGL